MAKTRTSWKPGMIPNPKGRPKKGETMTDILKEHLEDLGAYRVYFEQEIWIAAIGAKLDLFLPVASCVLNIGSSNCDIAIFQNGKTVIFDTYKVLEILRVSNRKSKYNVKN